MSGDATPAEGRQHAAGNRGMIATEARLRDLVEAYRNAGDDGSAGGGDLCQLVEEDQAPRLLQAWKGPMASLGAEVEAINTALDGTGVRLEAIATQPGPGVSYLACAEVRIEGDPHGPRPSAFAALTRRAEARLQIRLPGSVRHETRYIALAEIGGETWKDWLLDLLDANRLWKRGAG